MNVFDQLRSGLLTWRRIGHGLWPIRDWPDSVIKNYVSILGARCGDCPAQPAIFRVANGRDLLVLIRYVLNLLRRTDECDADDPVVLMETILFALIGLVYPEEPGERTIEGLLMDFQASGSSRSVPLHRFTAFWETALPRLFPLLVRLFQLP